MSRYFLAHLEDFLDEVELNQGVKTVFVTQENPVHEMEGTNAEGKKISVHRCMSLAKVSAVAHNPNTITEDWYGCSIILMDTIVTNPEEAEEKGKKADEQYDSLLKELKGRVPKGGMKLKVGWVLPGTGAKE